MLIARDRLAETSVVLRQVVREAAEIALSHFAHGERTTAQVWQKLGDSPVTEADIAVDRFLKDRLPPIAPHAGWLSEETEDDLTRLERQELWVVDPIDGTRAFLSGDPNWSISVALVRDGRPVLGIVLAPALDALYEAVDRGGANLNGTPLSASRGSEIAGARVAGPKPLIDTLEQEGGPVVRLPKVPSLALRLARVASGEIDAGLVSKSARDWDLAAADLILTEADGRLTNLTGSPLIYNRLELTHGVLVASGRARHRAAVDILARAERGASRGEG